MVIPIVWLNGFLSSNSTKPTPDPGTVWEAPPKVTVAVLPEAPQKNLPSEGVPYKVGPYQL